MTVEHGRWLGYKAYCYTVEGPCRIAARYVGSRSANVKADLELK